MKQLRPKMSEQQLMYPPLILHSVESSRIYSIADDICDELSAYLTGEIFSINKFDKDIKESKSFIEIPTEVPLVDEDGVKLLNDDGSAKTTMIMMPVFGEEYVPEKITILLNSGGGYCTSGISIYDVIKNSKTPIEIIVSGICMSATTTVLSAGHIRKSYKNTRFMIHNLSVGMWTDNLSKLRQNMAEHEETHKTLRRLYGESTKIPKEVLDDIFNNNKDLYFDAQQAKEWGLIDEIIE